MTGFKRRDRRGFTLIEMLVVLAIIGVLLGLGGTALFQQAERANVVADAASERAANITATTDYLLNNRNGIFNYDMVNAELTTNTVPAYGKSIPHRKQIIIATIATDGTITVDWANLHGPPIMGSFSSLIGEMNFLFTGNMVSDDPNISGQYRTVDSEGQNGNDPSWGGRIQNILKEQGNDVDSLSYTIKIKAGITKDNLKTQKLNEGDLVIYYGPKITSDDVGKSISVRAYDVATDTYFTVQTTVIYKKSGKYTFPVFKVPE